MRVVRGALALEDQALHDMGNDIALELVVRPSPEGDLTGYRLGKILLDNRIEPVGNMHLECLASIDLMT